MARKTREERREEERRIVAEMDAAMRPETGNTAPKTGDKPQPTMHCKRCKSLMENGVCPTCGYRVYIPMDVEKRKKIRIIVAAACLTVFAVLFIVLRLT